LPGSVKHWGTGTPATPAVDVVTVPCTGHDIALHPSADVSFAAINAWLTGQPSKPVRG
jgi:hypothetical protein